MSLDTEESQKIQDTLAREPRVNIFLRPIAPPAALGLAGFAGSTFITATYIARWWGNEDSPLIFFPFVAFWGGLGQFIAAFFGYAARDTLVTVVHALWGSFWMSIGLLYLLVVRSYSLSRELYGKLNARARLTVNEGNRRPPTPPNRHPLPRTSLLVHSPNLLHLVRRTRRHSSRHYPLRRADLPRHRLDNRLLSLRVRQLRAHRHESRRVLLDLLGGFGVVARYGVFG